MLRIGDEHGAVGLVGRNGQQLQRLATAYLRRRIAGNDQVQRPPTDRDLRHPQRRMDHAAVEVGDGDLFDPGLLPPPRTHRRPRPAHRAAQIGQTLAHRAADDLEAVAAPETLSRRIERDDAVRRVDHDRSIAQLLEHIDQGSSGFRRVPVMHGLDPRA